MVNAPAQPLNSKTGEGEKAKGVVGSGPCFPIIYVNGRNLMVPPPQLFTAAAILAKASVSFVVPSPAAPNSSGVKVRCGLLTRVRFVVLVLALRVFAIAGLVIRPPEDSFLSQPATAIVPM